MSLEWLKVFGDSPMSTNSTWLFFDVDKRVVLVCSREWILVKDFIKVLTYMRQIDSKTSTAREMLKQLQKESEKKMKLSPVNGISDPI